MGKCAVSSQSYKKKKWEGQDQNKDFLLMVTNSSSHKMLSNKNDAQNA